MGALPNRTADSAGVVAAPPEPEQGQWRFPQYGLVGLVLLMAFLIRFTVPGFYHADNIFNLLRQASMLGIVAIGQTLVLLVAGIDLSVGAVIGMTVVVIAEFGRGGPLQLLFAIALVFVLCLIIGGTNGTLITVRRMPPFIATLAMGVVVEGARLAYTHGLQSGEIPDALRPLGLAGVAFVPYCFLLWVVLAGGLWVALTRMSYGRQVYATGINRVAARLSGIRVDRVVLSTYVLCSLLAGVAGLVLSAWVGFVDRYLGRGYDLDSIAAAVVGGTSFVGGRGGIPGTVAGVFFLTILLNLLVLTGINPELQFVVKGVVIVGAIALYGFRSGEHR